MCVRYTIIKCVRYTIIKCVIGIPSSCVLGIVILVVQFCAFLPGYACVGTSYKFFKLCRDVNEIWHHQGCRYQGGFAVSAR